MRLLVRHAEPLVRSGYVPGVVLGVYRDGQEQFVALGAVSYDSDTRPDEHTLYETGSVGKLYTALLLAEADRRGELSLDGLIRQSPSVRRETPALAGSTVAIWHLAAHLSGLPREPDNLNDEQPNPYAGYNEAMLWDYLSRVALQDAPGERYDYSNLAVGLLGIMLEEAAGLSYVELVRQRIALPLALPDTAAELAPEQAERLAPPHALGVESINWPADDALAASGCLRSTAADTLRFVRLHLDPPDTPMGRSMQRTTEQRYAFEQGGGIGLGWHILEDGTRWHNGSTGGYHSFVAFHREHDLALAVLANDSCPEVTELGFHLLDALTGVADQPIEIKEAPVVSAASLDTLVGRYVDPESGYSITVTRRGTRLLAQLTDQPAFLVLPETETLFRYRSVDAALRFARDREGVAARVTLLQDGTEWTLRRAAE